MTNEMSGRERILAAIKGQEVDRLPYCPFMAYWWEMNKKPEDSQIDFLRNIDAIPFYRGSCTLFKIKRKNCDIRESITGKTKRLVYSTKYGDLTAGYIYSSVAASWFLNEHPVKTEEDFKLLKYIFDDVEVLPDYQEFDRQSADMGDIGLVTPYVGVDYKTSFQSLVEYWVGTEELNYALCDYPEVIEDTLVSMQVVNKKAVEISSAHKACEAIIFFEDSSTTNISPGQFQKYAMNEITGWANLIHEDGHLLIHHACGHVKDLLPLIKQTGIDCLESISPPPTGNIEIWDAVNILGPGISVVGGIEPTVFEGYGNEELKEYVINLLEKMPSRGFVVSNSDSCPPGVSENKFKLVSDIVKNWNVR